MPGQKTSVLSVPVVIASDQSAVPVTLSGSGASSSEVQGTAADGAAAAGKPVQIGGVDGSGNMQALLIYTNGVPPVVNYELTGVLADSAGAGLTVKRAFANVAASQTDSSIVAAVASKSLRVVSVAMITGGTATNVTFNTKPAGAGTAISPLFANGVNSGAVLPYNPHGWFQTTAGEGLTVTTGAGSTTGILVTYIEA